MLIRGAARAWGPGADAAGAIPRARSSFDPRAILTSIGEAVYDWDLTSDAISWGVNASDVLGVADIAALATGRDFALAVEPGSGPTRHETILGSGERDVGSGVPYRTRYAVRLGGTRVLMVEDTGRWYADAAGTPAFAHGVVRVEVAGEEALGPAGRERSALIGAISAEVTEAARTKRAVSVLVAAVTGLGALNDELGFEGAEAVLSEVARRLRTVMRRRDRLSRYAGNRFGIALLSCPPGQAAVAAGRLVSAVGSQPILTARGPLVVSLRVGAASAPDHAGDAAGLLRRAEDALGAAKRATDRTFVLYDHTLGRDAARPNRGTQALDVIEALNDRRIVFARQPVRESHSRGIAFHEALVRIRTPGGTLVGAGEILPAVERAGLVPLLDTRMLELATDHLAAHPDDRLSINVSPLTLESPDWLGGLAAHLGARPGVASRLIVEVTETAAVGNPEAMRARLDAMKALGIAIAIDDFGAGHTSFKHLRGFPVDLVKIDGAFVQNLSRSTDDRFFVRTLVDLAHHLGIAIVAEWVEDEETALMLAGWGVDYLQGDHCGRPVVAPAEPLARRA